MLVLTNVMPVVCDAFFTAMMTRERESRLGKIIWLEENQSVFYGTYLLFNVIALCIASWYVLDLREEREAV